MRNIYLHLAKTQIDREYGRYLCRSKILFLNFKTIENTFNFAKISPLISL